MRLSSFSLPPPSISFVTIPVSMHASIVRVYPQKPLLRQVLSIDSQKPQTVGRPQPTSLPSSSRSPADDAPCFIPPFSFVTSHFLSHFCLPPVSGCRCRTNRTQGWLVCGSQHAVLNPLLRIQPHIGLSSTASFSSFSLSSAASTWSHSFRRQCPGLGV